MRNLAHCTSLSSFFAAKCCAILAHQSECAMCMWIGCCRTWTFFMCSKKPRHRVLAAPPCKCYRSAQGTQRILTNSPECGYACAAALTRTQPFVREQESCMVWLIKRAFVQLNYACAREQVAHQGVAHRAQEVYRPWMWCTRCGCCGCALRVDCIRAVHYDYILYISMYLRYYAIFTAAHAHRTTLRHTRTGAIIPLRLYLAWKRRAHTNTK